MINLKRNAQSILDQLTEWHPEGNGILAVCPSHSDEHPSLKVDINEDGRILLYCRAGCQFVEVAKALGVNQGDTWKWPDTMEGAGAVGSTPSMVDEEALQDLSQYIAHAKDMYSGSVAEDYALERFGITPHMAKDLKLGFSPRFERITWSPIKASWSSVDRLVVPFLGFDGEPIGAQARALSDHMVKWSGLANAHDGSTWGRYSWLDRKDGLDYVIITEGPSDGLTAYSAGYSAVVIRGAALGRQDTLLDELATNLDGRIVIVAGDNDPSGESFRDGLVKNLSDKGIDARALPIKGEHNDLNDWFQASGAEVFSQELNEAVRNTQQSSLSSTSPWDRLSGDHSLAHGVTNGTAAEAVIWYFEQTNRKLHFVPGLGIAVFDGERYQLDPTQRPLKLALREVIQSARGYENPTNPLGDKIRVLGNKLSMTHFMKSTIDMLDTVVDSTLHAYDFDARDHYLQAVNGVIDLTTGELLEPTAEMLITTQLDVPYDPEAECPRWEQFLEEVMLEDPEMVEFLQRLVGYGITGSTVEQCFAIFQGQGANGKSVFTDTLAHVFKNITRTVPYATFETASFNSGSSGPSSNIARLRGSRLVFTSEGQEGKPMDEALIKSLTGGDVITARFQYAEEFEFKPHHLIVMSTNHIPRFRGVDEGLWRRVKLIPFNRYFAPKERQANLPSVLQSESAGILRWAVEGAVKWYADGLKEPSKVSDFTADVRDELNPLNGFLPGVLKYSPDSRLLLRDAYDVYTNWCMDESNDYPLGKQKFRHRLQAQAGKRIEYKRLTDGQGFIGLAKMSVAEQQDYLREISEDEPTQD